MKILQINSVYGYGSTGRIVQSLHHALQKAGHESYVIYGRGDNTSEENIFKIGNTFEQAIDLVGTRLLNRHAQFNYYSTDKIIKKIITIKPDIVHLHNLHGYYTNFRKLVTFLKKSKIKVVWLLHDPWIISGRSALKNGLEYNWEKEINLNQLKKIANEYPKHSSFSSQQGISNYNKKIFTN